MSGFALGTNTYVRGAGELGLPPELLWPKMAIAEEYGLKESQDVNGDSEAAYADGVASCSVGWLQRSEAFAYLYDPEHQDNVYRSDSLIRKTAMEIPFVFGPMRSNHSNLPEQILRFVETNP